MNILHFYKTAFPYSVGGVEMVINELAKGSVSRGHQVDVVALADVAEQRTLDGYTVHSCKTLFEAASTPVSFRAAIEFKKLARKADVINYHFPWPYMDVVHFATGVNKPTVVTYHSDVVRQRRAARLYAPLRHAFLNSVDAIVATSPNYRATSVTLQSLSKVEVIPLGITDTASTSIEPDNLRGWRDRFGEHFFLFVGALRYYKGLRTLIDAAQGTSVPIVIAGAGPTERELRAQAKRLNVDNVHLVGHVSDADKASLLTLCRAVVFPSDLRSEAFGVTLLEGAMFAKPLISSEIGTGTTYVNIDGETGIVVPPRDPAALRSAMQRICSNPSWAVEAGRRARLRYEALFTADSMCREYLRLYEDLLLRRKSVDLCSDAHA